MEDPTQKSTSPLIYWMRSCHRFFDNGTLHHAAKLASTKGTGLLVLAFTDAFNPWYGHRHRAFMLQGLEALLSSRQDASFSFEVLDGNALDLLPGLARQLNTDLVITELAFMSHERQELEVLAPQLPVQLLTHGSDTLVAVHDLYPRAAWSAAVIRHAYNKRLFTMEDLAERKIDPCPSLDAGPLPSAWPFLDQERLRTLVDQAEREAGRVMDYFHGGVHHAREALFDFLETRLGEYGTKRMDPASSAGSRLSPYLHFGHIGPREICREVLAWGEPDGDVARGLSKRLYRQGGFFDKAVPDDSVAAFLEELIVRRELAYNWAWYGRGAIRFEALPDWARASLDSCREDTRTVLYTRDELAASATHDPVWNACQRELNQTGIMHGYLRMYWGKQILQWSVSPEQALETMEYLNNTLALDGSNPNSMAGILWCLGLHDRPWARRPVSGSTRAMTLEGLKRKFTMDRYLDQWSDAGNSRELF